MKQTEAVDFNALQFRDPARCTSSDSTITIAVAVPIEASWEWGCLLSTLDHLNWQVRNRKVALKLLGGKFSIQSTKPVDIEYLGIHPSQKTIDLLSTFDVLYCPQKFDQTHRSKEATSLPIELRYFLASGRPTLIHAPTYALSSQLLLPEQACANSQSHEAINIELYNALDRLTFDADFYAMICSNGHKLIKNSQKLFLPTNQNNSFVCEADSTL